MCVIFLHSIVLPVRYTNFTINSCMNEIYSVNENMLNPLDSHFHLVDTFLKHDLNTVEARALLRRKLKVLLKDLTMAAWQCLILNSHSTDLKTFSTEPPLNSTSIHQFNHLSLI